MVGRWLKVNIRPNVHPGIAVKINRSLIPVNLQQQQQPRRTYARSAQMFPPHFRSFNFLLLSFSYFLTFLHFLLLNLLFQRCAIFYSTNATLARTCTLSFSLHFSILFRFYFNVVFTLSKSYLYYLQFYLAHFIHL